MERLGHMSNMFDPARSMRRGQCSGFFQRRKDTGKIAFVVPYFQELISERRPFYKQAVALFRGFYCVVNKSMSI